MELDYRGKEIPKSEGNYPTPYPLAKRIVEEYISVIQMGSCVLDPGAGAGVFGGALRAAGYNRTIEGVELRSVEKPSGYNHWMVGDFLDDIPMPDNYDTIIGNPPYGRVMPRLFLKKAFDLVSPNGQIIFLLRSGVKNTKWFQEEFVSRGKAPTEIQELVGRPHFKGDGTDTHEYAVFYWNMSYISNGIVTSEMKWMLWK